MKKNIFKNKSILITGGTGSYGYALTNYFIKKKYPFRKIIIFSRDELKQFMMKKKLDDKKYHNLRYLIGDVRDKERLKTAFNDVDFIVHAAALKQVNAAEYNPIEFIKTNVIGAQNIVECALESNISKIIALSTDKASSPNNLYGATKLCSDKIFINANNIVGKKNLKFSVLRYGNVMGSRGSVLNEFLEQKKKGKLYISDKLVTRFHIDLQNAIDVSIVGLSKMLGGEIFIPKIKSYKLLELAKAVCENCKIKNTGLGAGEKLHEEMISLNEIRNTYDLGNYYVIVDGINVKKYKKYKKITRKKAYTSDTNEFIKYDELKKAVLKYKADVAV